MWTLGVQLEYLQFVVNTGLPVRCSMDVVCGLIANSAIKEQSSFMATNEFKSSNFLTLYADSVKTEQQ